MSLLFVRYSHCGSLFSLCIAPSRYILYRKAPNTQNVFNMSQNSVNFQDFPTLKTDK